MRQIRILLSSFGKSKTVSMISNCFIRSRLSYNCQLLNWFFFRNKCYKLLHFLWSFGRRARLRATRFSTLKTINFYHQANQTKLPRNSIVTSFRCYCHAKLSKVQKPNSNTIQMMLQKSINRSFDIQGQFY